MLTIDLTGHLALITGATGQLGRAMARTLAGCGAGVAVHYLHNQEKATELVDQIRSAGVPAIAVQGDITVQEDILSMRETITRAIGTPDIIVTNAVIQYDWTSVLQQGLADYESQFRSCVLQNVIMAQAFLPAMIAKKWGRVIAINTECSIQAFPGQSAYIAGKRGMDGLLRVLAKEVGEHQVTVNQVAPGWMISDNSPASDDDGNYSSQVPLKRRGDAQDIANTVAFLASDLANYITGQFISVSGGNVMPAI